MTEIEKLRERWDPQNKAIRVRIPFIDTVYRRTLKMLCKRLLSIFYQETGNLYNATREAFIENYGISIPRNKFLHFFKMLGRYLVDLFKKPNKKVRNAKKVNAYH
jgi:hypothetical protein